MSRSSSSSFGSSLMRLDSLWIFVARVVGRQGARERVDFLALAVQPLKRILDWRVGSPRRLSLGDAAGELAHSAQPLAPIEPLRELRDARALVLRRALLDEQRSEQAADRLVVEVAHEALGRRVGTR